MTDATTPARASGPDLAGLTNVAAWLDAPFADLTVRPAPVTAPGPHELLVRARAVAVNPVDVVKQTTGDLMYRWLPAPAVLGEDVAGDVVAVGSAVTRFAVGDRVVALAVGVEKGEEHAPGGGFQQLVLVREALAAPVPAGTAFEEAVVLPLAVSTAASALFQGGQLGLRHPVGAGPAPIEGAREVVVVWGGTTSVGSAAIQLAVAAGYDVVATASPANHDRLRALGASQLLDYRDAGVVDDVVAALRGRRVAGVLAIGTGSADPCVTIAARTGAPRVSMASPSVSFGGVPRRPGLSLGLVRTVVALGSRTAAVMVRSRLRGVRATFVWGSSLMHDEVGPMLWAGYLPAALAEGRFVPAPRAEVVGHGLEHVQAALDRLGEGVSATKLVVTL